MDKRKYPFDLLTMKSFGLDEWINGYFDEWPITVDEIIEINSSIQKIFHSYILEGSDGYSDILLAGYKLYYECSIFTIHAIAFDRLTRNNYDVVYNHNTPYLGFLSDKDEEIKTYSYSNKLIPKIPNTSYKIKQRINNYLRYNRDPVSDLTSNNNKNNFLCVSYPTKKLIDFANSHNRGLKIVYPYNFIGNYNYKTNDFREITNSIITDVVDVINHFGTTLDNHKISQLKSLTINILEKIDLNVFQISKYFMNIKPTLVLTPIFGNIFSRSACIAAKRNNHKVVGHSHGGNIGMLTSSVWGAIDLALADEYIVENNISKELWKSYATNHELVDEKRIKFTIVEGDYFKNLSKKTNKQYLNKIESRIDIKTIMIYELNMKHVSLGSPHYYWQYLLDLLLRVAKDLKTNGFTTILKRSPMSLVETNNLYNKFFDRIIDDKFEECFYEADAILFIYSTSTGFPFSLHTKLPVVIFSHELDHYQDYVQADLKERISVVKTSFVKNKIMYNEAELIKAFTNNRNNLNQNFINKYYLS